MSWMTMIMAAISIVCFGAAFWFIRLIARNTADRKAYKAYRTGLKKDRRQFPERIASDPWLNAAPSRDTRIRLTADERWAKTVSPIRRESV